MHTREQMLSGKMDFYRFAWRKIICLSDKKQDQFFCFLVFKAIQADPRYLFAVITGSIPGWSSLFMSSFSHYF
jgi:hypothetical protein